MGKKIRTKAILAALAIRRRNLAATDTQIAELREHALRICKAYLWWCAENDPSLADVCAYLSEDIHWDKENGRPTFSKQAVPVWRSACLAATTSCWGNPAPPWLAAFAYSFEGLCNIPAFGITSAPHMIPGDLLGRLDSLLRYRDLFLSWQVDVPELAAIAKSAKARA